MSFVLRYDTTGVSLHISCSHTTFAYMTFYSKVDDLLRVATKAIRIFGGNIFYVLTVMSLPLKNVNHNIKQYNYPFSTALKEGILKLSLSKHSGHDGGFY